MNVSTMRVLLIKNCVYFDFRTNVQRIISGPVSSGLKGPESVLHVKYTSFPVNYETDLKILDTDYENFAVMYSCSRIGPIGLYLYEIFLKENIQIFSFKM